MTHFAYRNGALHAEAVPLSSIAERHGTPCFVYRAAVAERAFTDLRAALPPGVRVAYAVKANPHPVLLERLARLGASFDCASAASSKAKSPGAAARGSAVALTAAPPPAPWPRRCARRGT